MQRQEFITIFGLERRRMEALTRALIAERAFERMAENLAPHRITHAHAAGLDALERHGVPRTIAFAAASDRFVVFLRDWRETAEHSHFDFIRAVRDPQPLGFDDALEAISLVRSGNALSMLLDIATDMVKHVAHSGPRIRSMATYLDRVLQLDEAVHNFAHETLWFAISGETSRRF